jgi:hypothetical protein
MSSGDSPFTLLCFYFDTKLCKRVLHFFGVIDSVTIPESDGRSSSNHERDDPFTDSSCELESVGLSLVQTKHSFVFA